MDDHADMDLALNGDFDAELFDCWDSAAEQEAEAVVNAAASHRHGHSNDHLSHAASDAGAVTNNHGSLTFDQVLQHTKASANSNMDWAGRTASSLGVQATSSDQTMQFRAPLNVNMNSSAQSQAPTGAEVSVSESNSSGASSSFHQMLSNFASIPQAHQRSMDPRAILSSANCPPHAGGSSGNVTTSSAEGSSASNSNDNSSRQTQQQQQASIPLQQQQQPQQVPFDLTSAALLPLAMNALAAGVTLPLPLVLQAAQQAQQAIQQTQQFTFAAPGPPLPAPAATTTNAPFAAPPPRPPQAAANAATMNQSGGATTAATTAPFYLGDAPAELRANFLDSQRAAGMAPLLQDSINSQFPFGIAVNGFHPQHNLSAMQLGSFDTRQTTTVRNNTKNVKEQRRAQKITDLIDNLRMKMEKDGWQVGLNKSKFNTLSCCADYIRHLVKLTEEKEATVKKTQCDLEAARKKLDDDKIQSDRSDPESTTSSLTVSSGSAATHDKKSSKEGNTPHTVDCSNDKKRHGDDCNQHSTDPKHPAKRLRYQESTESGTSSNGSDHGYTVKMGNTESVSDLTDSNKGSVSGSGSGSDEACSEPAPATAKNEECDSDDDVLSDAAVAIRKAEEQHQSSTTHTKKRKHSSLPPDHSSFQHGFELDFEEVFVNSNIPQLLATTDGRILAWNKFFLKATGFNQESIKKATIFGLVKCSKLANLFEIVAKALRNKSQPTGNYLATTLPCVKFHAVEHRQLYITVTFMSDVDPRKRCFHCVLTDSPPTTESPGPVTEDLLFMLLSEGGDCLAKKRKVASHGLHASETDSKAGSDKADQDAADEDEEEGTADEGPFSADDDDGDTLDD